MNARTIPDAELQHTRALQRYQSAKAACMEMHGSLSILVVPRADFGALAAASWDVKVSRDRLGDLQARHRALVSYHTHTKQSPTLT